MNYWLVKSEPFKYSWDDLVKDGSTYWDGVRNYQARNNLKLMKKGDLVFFYHSNCKVPGIVGIAEVVKESYPDFTSWNPESNYFDPKSTADSPRWFMVDIKFKRQLKRTISLNELKEMPGREEMDFVRRGNRLSIMPVSEQEWGIILAAE